MTQFQSVREVTTLSDTEAAVLAHAINRDPSEGKPYAEPRYVAGFTATYAVKCIRAVLADTTITNMTATERADLNAILGRLLAAVAV